MSTSASPRVTVDSPEDVVALLRDGSPGVRSMAVGGGTLLGRGGPIGDHVRRIELSRHDRILELAHEDLTITVEAGARMQDVQRALTEKDLWLPLSVLPSPQATIGGWIGGDRRGPLVGGWGSMRDYLLGVTFVSGAGEIVRAGGRVVKNVAGYDLMKLLIGSLGELGIVLDATLKVLPRPRAWGVVGRLGFDKDGALQREIALKLAPAGLWRLDLGEGEGLVAGYAGPPARVAHQLAATRVQWGSASTVWEGDDALGLVAQLEALTRPDVRPVAWGGALPAHLARATFPKATPRQRWLADLLGGHVWAEDPGPEGIASLRQVLAEGEGHLHRDVPSGSPAPEDAWGREPKAERALWISLRNALDPAGRLVAGRLPGGV